MWTKGGSAGKTAYSLEHDAIMQIYAATKK
jgi:hypothetical protein